MNTPRNITLKYIFYICSCWKQNINDSYQMLQIKKTFYFEIIKCILDENQLLQAAQKKSFLCLIFWICKWQATKHWTFLFIKCVNGYLRMRFFKKYDLANLFTSIHTKMINKLKPSGLSWNNLEHVRSISNKVDPLVPRLNHQQTD